jgi:type IV pilus assembly protein PilB
MSAPARAAAPARLDVIAHHLGKVLVAEGRLPARKLEEIVRQATETVWPGWALVTAGALTEDEWVERIATHFGLASARIADFTIDPALIVRVPEELARRNHLLPLCTAGTEIYVAVADPTRLDTFDHLRRLLKAPITTVVVSPNELAAAHERHYLRDGAVDFEHIANDENGELSAAEVARLKEEAESGRAVQLVDRLLAHAIGVNATDIHIETTLHHLRVRFRVDGMLREGPRYPSALSPMVVSRVKVLAQLDISERWVPQDGRVRIRRPGHDLDLRVSVVPVARGEKVVIRLLSAGRERGSIADLNLPAHTIAKFHTEIERPHGMVLVTGPTGSGKTSTLYGLLSVRARPDTNVITIEDPVEYEQEALNQIPVNAKRGVTFATALRGILRQDPDVILVGEIRDKETALIACEAALTGHLLLSTLHTNDAASATLRLVEMGVPRFLVASVLNAVVAQRLVRRVCGQCAEEFAPSEDELARLGAGLEVLAREGITLVRGRGCNRCEGTGVRGRLPIVELMVIDEELRAMIGRGAPMADLHAHAVAHGMIDLRGAALERLFAGETTIEEVVRVCALQPGGAER